MREDTFELAREMKARADARKAERSGRGQSPKLGRSVVNQTPIDFVAAQSQAGTTMAAGTAAPPPHAVTDQNPRNSAATQSPGNSSAGHSPANSPAPHSPANSITLVVTQTNNPSQQTQSGVQTPQQRPQRPWHRSWFSKAGLLTTLILVIAIACLVIAWLFTPVKGTTQGTPHVISAPSRETIDALTRTPFEIESLLDGTLPYFRGDCADPSALGSVLELRSLASSISSLIGNPFFDHTVLTKDLDSDLQRWQQDFNQVCREKYTFSWPFRKLSCDEPKLQATQWRIEQQSTKHISRIREHDAVLAKITPTTQRALEVITELKWPAESVEKQQECLALLTVLKSFSSTQELGTAGTNRQRLLKSLIFLKNSASLKQAVEFNRLLAELRSLTRTLNDEWDLFEQTSMVKQKCPTGWKTCTSLDVLSPRTFSPTETLS